MDEGKGEGASTSFPQQRNCAIKILSPMTHTEPISVIVWQGNNITEPINILWGAALLMEQDVALTHPDAGPGSLLGKAQPSLLLELAAPWPCPRGEGQKDMLQQGCPRAAPEVGKGLGENHGQWEWGKSCVSPGDT